MNEREAAEKALNAMKRLHEATGAAVTLMTNEIERHTGEMLATELSVMSHLELEAVCTSINDQAAAIEAANAEHHAQEEAKS